VNFVYLAQFRHKIVDLFIAATDNGIHRIIFDHSLCEDELSHILDTKEIIKIRFPFPQLLVKLQQYLQGDRIVFDEPLDMPEATEFQYLVWNKVREIPYGMVSTYAQVAKEIGHPKASRAVGRANGANLLPIIIPCHRVITADGKLGGYSAGIHIKDKLLRLERAVI
jgi:O-6-methylguanine DNA methyltransferase